MTSIFFLKKKTAGQYPACHSDPRWECEPGEAYPRVAAPPNALNALLCEIVLAGAHSAIIPKRSGAVLCTDLGERRESLSTDLGDILVDAIESLEHDDGVAADDHHAYADLLSSGFLL